MQAFNGTGTSNGTLLPTLSQVLLLHLLYPSASACFISLVRLHPWIMFTGRMLKLEYVVLLDPYILSRSNVFPFSSSRHWQARLALHSISSLSIWARPLQHSAAALLHRPFLFLNATWRLFATFCIPVFL